MPNDAAAVPYNRLRDYINKILGEHGWPDEVRWRIYQIKHAIFHALRRSEYSYDTFVAFYFNAGMAMGMAFANKDLDSILDELPKPSEDCGWPWTYPEYLVIAEQARAADKEEGRPSDDAPRFD